MTTDSAALVRRLCAQLQGEMIETHISWVLLAGDRAWKVKKPVHLPFVDYSTLERRRTFCEEEVRLNRRLAASIYLGVARITGSAEHPAIDGDGPVLEYAVHMRRFAQERLFSAQLAAGTLREASVDALAQLLARFHASAPCAQAQVERHQAVMLACLDALAPLLTAADAEALRSWIVAQCAQLAPLWARRAAAGRVRQCHGDLHLANVVELPEGVAAFDCIEFDPALRCIDVLDDAAFALMDFAARGAPGLGWRFFDGWLEGTGDHDALPALRAGLVARALVRAQVEQLRAPGSDAARGYARTALAFSGPGAPLLAITHGLPGSGKTFASQQWLQAQGAIRLRSDVERKRLFGLAPLASSLAAGVDLYTPQATQQTYARLFALARGALQAGLPVVLDAAFLRRDEREEALALARELGVPFAILDCKAPLAVLRQRLLQRSGDASEADLAVLEKLRAAVEPLGEEERVFVSQEAGPQNG